MKICHVTTVHPPRDNRIFHKECVSLAEAGHDVSLLAAGRAEYSDERGVRTVMVPVRYRSRPGRMLKAPRILARKVISLKPDVVHFHDPEFLQVVGKLRRKGIKLIYDVHEDVPRQILAKSWIPHGIRHFLSARIERYENRRASRVDYVITATPFIAERFRKVNPKTGYVRNYPIPEEFDLPKKELSGPPHVCYVGGIAAIRGAKEMIAAIDGCEAVLDLAGSVESCEFFEELKRMPGWDRKIYHGMVDRKKVADLMSQAVAGLVLIHPIPNYLDALPTKLFEYMHAGIPVIYSDFPLWRELVEPHRCGIAVDPLDVEAIRKAIRFILANPGEAAEMGNRGRIAALKLFNWNVEKQKLLAVYDSLMK